MINFDDDIICLIVHNGNCRWYIADKNLWILDGDYLVEVWKKAGHTILAEWTPHERKSTRILSSDNVNVFLEQIEENRYSTEQLRTLLIKEKEKSFQQGYWYYDFYPSLLIDFDRKVLYNGDPEGTAYEDYVPKGWRGFYEDFLNQVPIDDRYWIDESGIDLFQQFKETKKKG